MTNNPISAKGAVIIGVTLSFATPPTVAAAGVVASIADRVVERNARGQFVIPGSQLKGKLRHACEQILRALDARICESPRPQTMCPNLPDIKSPCPACAIFGSPSFPSQLRFHDLIAETGDPDEALEVDASLRAMVSLNRRRMTAAEKKLFLVETAPYYSKMNFSNSRAVTGDLKDERQVKLLLAGLKLITAWGGMKSRGAGWTASAQAAATFNDKAVEGKDWREIERLW
jgi:CRISPR/Cas system CSM-associated protein Csm3 (group 7 of RAMP superfamily)